jgi:hypothetical protein
MFWVIALMNIKAQVHHMTGIELFGTLLSMISLIFLLAIGLHSIFFTKFNRLVVAVIGYMGYALFVVVKDIVLIFFFASQTTWVKTFDMLLTPFLCFILIFPHYVYFYSLKGKTE